MFDKATFVVDREQIVLQLQTFFSACKVRRSFEIAKVPVYGNTGCRVLKGDTKLERFLPKNQHTQRKLLNWFNGEVSKIPKFDF